MRKKRVKILLLSTKISIYIYIYVNLTSIALTVLNFRRPERTISNCQSCSSIERLLKINLALLTCPNYMSGHWGSSLISITFDTKTLRRLIGQLKRELGKLVKDFRNKTRAKRNHYYPT